MPFCQGNLTVEECRKAPNLINVETCSHGGDFVSDFQSEVGHEQSELQVRVYGQRQA